MTFHNCIHGTHLTSTCAGSLTKKILKVWSKSDISLQSPISKLKPPAGIYGRESEVAFIGVST